VTLLKRFRQVFRGAYSRIPDSDCQSSTQAVKISSVRITATFRLSSQRSRARGLDVSKPIAASWPSEPSPGGPASPRPGSLKPEDGAVKVQERYTSSQETPRPSPG